MALTMDEQGITGITGAKDVCKIFCHDREWPPPSMTCCHSSGGPSGIGLFHTAMPESSSGAEFANYQLTL